jgi:hypothetical protein
MFFVKNPERETNRAQKEIPSHQIGWILEVDVQNSDREFDFSQFVFLIAVV